MVNQTFDVICAQLTPNGGWHLDCEDCHGLPQVRMLNLVKILGMLFIVGVKKGREGWFEKANDGVLFLDEFQPVSTASQVQLLDLLSAVSDVIHIARTGEDHKRHRFNVKVT